MADIIKIRELAKELNLWNTAKGYVDLKDEKRSNLDYLEAILEKEIQVRSNSRTVKLRKSSKLPNKIFNMSNINNGTTWQIEQLLILDFIGDGQNIILLGHCSTGKTSLAVLLGKTAIEAGKKVFYTKLDAFIAVAKEKEHQSKARSVFKYIKECELIIVDDVFYTSLSREELQVFYRTLIFLSETTSIILISNREMSAWNEAAEDNHLMQTLLDRITSNSQILRLTEN